jgi:hypothetical protein
VQETLSVIERAGQLERLEISGTLSVTWPQPLEGSTTMKATEKRVEVDVEVFDNQLLLKALLLSKTVVCSKGAGPQSVLVPGQRQHLISGILPSAATSSSSSPSSSSSSSSSVSSPSAVADVAVPVLRYTFVEQFKPLPFKARNRLTLTTLTLSLDDQREDPFHSLIPSVSSTSSSLSDHKQQLLLAVQIVINPKFTFPLSEFTVQVSLAALRLIDKETGNPLGKLRLPFTRNAVLSR